MNDVSPDLQAEQEEEDALLAELRSGNDAAYERFVRATTPRLLAVARRILGSEDDAQDALQDAYTSAFRALDRFEGKARLSTWLHRIVVNRALMRLRTRKRHPEESIDRLLPPYSEDGHQAHEPVEWSDGVDVALERREVREYVRAQIDRLPEGYRTVLLLRDIEEISTHETAEVLGITENAVKIRLHRARLALRALLDQRFRPPSHSDAEGNVP